MYGNKEIEGKENKIKETTCYKINQRKQLKTLKKCSINFINWRQSADVEDQMTEYLYDEMKKRNKRKSKKKVTKDNRKQYKNKRHEGLSS